MRTNFERYHSEDKNSLKDKLKDGFTLRFTVTRLLVLFGACILLLIWAFFIGILVGRGERPEEKIPEIARMMPKEAAATLNASAKDASNSTASAATSSLRSNSTGIIEPEKLGFMHSLKTKPTRDDLTKAPLSTSIPPKKKPKKDDKTTGDGNLSVAKSSGKNIFNYQYQVATASDKPSAQKIKDRLRKKGMSPSIHEAKEDGKTSYQLFVAFKGAPEDTRKLRAALKQEGLDTFIMRSKVAVK